MIAALVAVMAAAGCATLAKAPPGKLAKPVRCVLPRQIPLSQKIRVIGVFTTWDVKSQVQMSRFEKVRPLFGDRIGFAYIFIDNDSRMVDGWVSLYKPAFPVLYHNTLRLCGNRVNRVPVTLIVGASGKICYSYQGPATTKTLHAQISDALKTCK